MVITQVFGDVCLSHGMKNHGEITSFSPSAIIDVILYVFSSIWFYFAILSLAVSWFLYMFSVSKMDLSYVLPIQASSYIVNAFLAWLLLGEVVSPLRWLATAIISVGVFIVGYTEYKSEKQFNIIVEIPKEKVSKILLFLPMSGFFPLIWLGIFAMVLADSLGDFLNAKGMREIQSLTSFSFFSIIKWSIEIFTNISIWLGISFQIIALFLFLSLLSWDDLSIVRPAGAISNIISFIFAKYLLHERINQGRFIGICVILAGVISLSLDH